MSGVRSERKREIPGLARVARSIVYRHVFENADREVGGVLVGRIPKAGQMPLVTGAIPAIAADEQRATLTFTQDSWEHVHRALDRDYPDDQIVGWYHSHPSFGIFLSGHDLFIHRNFFGGRSQIAYVVDPVGQEEGVFAWRPSTDDVDLYFKQATPAGWDARTSQGERLVKPPRGGGQHEVVAEDARGRIRLSKWSAFPLAVLAAFAVAFAITYSTLRATSGGSTTTVTTTTTSNATKAPGGHK